MKRKRLKKAWFYAFMLCVSLVFCGCGATGESQFTTMDEKYLQADQVTESPENTEQGLEIQQQTAAPAEDTIEPSQGAAGEKRDDSADVDGSGKKKEQAQRKSQDDNEKETTSLAKSKKQTLSDKRSEKRSDKKKPSQKKQDISVKKDEVQPSKTPKTEEKKYCTVSIDCQTILSNMSDLKTVKKEFVPDDGWILKPLRFAFEEGETAYDILYRVCREKKIHMEAAYTPAYSTYYVEGIHQLYEFDCGTLSGWTYLVNGMSLNYGASKYKVQAGDEICWRFSCNAGKDVR